MKFIKEHDIERFYTMKDCIEDMKEGFRLYNNKKTYSPVRTILHHAELNSNTLFMPSYIEDLEYETVKVVSVFPNNSGTSLPSLQGIILLTETRNGEHVAIIEASGLTVMRTGAAAGVATQYLAKEDASCLSILGCGAQARGQLKAMLEVRPIKEIFLWNRTKEKAIAFKEEIERFQEWTGKIVVCEDANEAASKADILVLSTKSEESLFDGDVLKPGVHINAIGAYRPDMKEFGADTLRKADQVWVDTLEGVQHESGDLIQPVNASLWSWDQLTGEIAELVTGLKQGRQSPEEITLYKSVGVSYMDTIAAAKVYEQMLKRG
ncbi:ornithine cyclodeaminase family protein [Cytobacillus sp. FJAT-53684]|uniref:Ornithine cyclodeaminase family protein n=1 Tax=Cytobacillus mangrovibacter TaxID=3299024 RepID=A0ABW6K4H8_9BACI